MRRCLFLIPLLFLAGCATVPLNTASGKPETTIHGVTKKQVMETLTSKMVNCGYTLKTATDYNAVFEAKSKNAWTNAIFGSNFNSAAGLRVNYNLIDVQDGVRIVAHPEIVTNPGSGFENTTDASTGASGEEINKFLELMRQNLEKPTGAPIS